MEQRTDMIGMGLGNQSRQEAMNRSELLLQLLYHPDILPGMNAQECEQVIRALYY